MGIIIAILIFSFIIFFHELGHFVLAKLNGIEVQEFAIGMGPALRPGLPVSFSFFLHIPAVFRS